MALSGGWRVELRADLEDDVSLNTAVDGRATLLVTGDKTDLLALRRVDSIPIVSAREAVKRPEGLGRRSRAQAKAALQALAASTLTAARTHSCPRLREK